MSDVEKTINDRWKSHGDFAAVAATYSRLMKEVETSGAQLHPVHRMCLEMIFHKVARIVNGDPNFPDHWHDIAGYAALAERGFRGEKKL